LFLLLPGKCQTEERESECHVAGKEEMKLVRFLFSKEAERKRETHFFFL
jgi:hypothetical protein